MIRVCGRPETKVKVICKFTFAGHININYFQIPMYALIEKYAGFCL